MQTVGFKTLKSWYCSCAIPKTAEIIVRCLVLLQKYSPWPQRLAVECQCAAVPVSHSFDSLVPSQTGYDTKTSTADSSAAENSGSCSYGTIPSPVNRYIKPYVKVKFSRYRAGVAQRVGTGIALLFHDHSTRRGWVVSSMPRPHFTPGKTQYTFYRSLSGPQDQSGRSENLVPTGIRSRAIQSVVSHYTDWATRPT